MKIEKINENKIKITLDVNDLNSRNIDAKSFISNTPESQDLFWDVLKEAETRYGFCVDESMVYVEAHLNPNGVFTLIVTKSTSNGNIFTNNKKAKSGIKLKRSFVDSSLDNAVYKFNSATALKSYIKVLKPSNFGHTSLYAFNNNFYLDFEKLSDDTILEYATKDFDSSKTRSRLMEYGNVVYKDNAITELKKLIK